MAEMDLSVWREPSTAHSTPGKLYIGDRYECFTLEDVVRPDKIHSQTAIPAGRYQVIINHSNRFGRDMPLLLNVPGFEGIRIHSGNTDANTDGCILVGVYRAPDRVWGSRVAFKALFRKLQAAVANKDEIWINVLSHKTPSSNTSLGDKNEVA